VAAADRAPPAGPPNVPATSAEASPAAVAEPPAEDRGSRTGPMLAVVVVALIGAAGARQVWLRRHPADGG
jgi:hypothetical protein